MALVLTAVEDAIGFITLNNPKKLNSLSRTLIDDLISALSEMNKTHARAVILRAQPGAHTWSAGHDIHELEADGHDPQAYSDPLRRAVRTIERFRAPVIAMIEGGVWGGACEIVMSCDLIVATPQATFAITPAKLGVAYSLDGTLNFMKSVGLPFLKEMLFTAAPISAQRALNVGMINHVIPADELESFTRSMAKTISKNSPLGISLLKEELRILAEAHALTPEAFERIQNLRSRLYGSEDYQEGIRAFFEKRTPDFKGK